jgi:hypothetical protein
VTTVEDDPISLLELLKASAAERMSAVGHATGVPVEVERWTGLDTKAAAPARSTQTECQEPEAVAEDQQPAQAAVDDAHRLLPSIESYALRLREFPAFQV